MKTITLHASAVALAAATLCWHQGAHAAATESQLRGVTLYGNVSIQEDSTGSWGPWAEFEPPAAGNNPPVAAPRVAGDPYRPLAQVGGDANPSTPPVNPPVTPPIVEGFCVGGSLCGFGAFVDGDPNESGEGGLAADINAFRLNGTVPASQGEASLLPPVIQLAATVLSDTGKFQLPNSGDLKLPTEGESGISYSRYGYDGQRLIELYELTPDGTRIDYDPESNQAAHFNLSTYIRGTVQTGWGVIGYATSTADMAALRASSAQATYNGFDHYGTPVNMTVNFGNSTWSGSLNGGSDGAGVVAATSASGGTLLRGTGNAPAVGLIITNGSVVGSTFSATAANLSANDGTIQAGRVAGAFTGPQAAAAIGVVDVTKTRPEVYTNGRYVAPFIAIKQDNTPR